MANQFTKGYALLVAVDEQRVAGWELPIAGKDVLGLAFALTEPHLCAYAPDHVKVVAGTHATRQGILDGFEWLTRRLRADASGDPTAFVYLSGRVWRDTRTSSYHLIPCDGEKDADWTFLPFADISALIESVSARHLFVAFDGHHLFSTVSGDERAHSDASQTSWPWPGGDRYTDPGQGCCVFLSSSLAEEPSYVRRDGAMSIFTYHLTEAVIGFVPSAVNRTEVLASDVVDHVSRRVPETALSEYGRQQTPSFLIHGDFPLALRLGGLDPDEVRRLWTDGGRSPESSLLTGFNSLACSYSTTNMVRCRLPMETNGNAAAKRPVRVGDDETVGRDMIATGNVEGSGIAIGADARATVNKAVDGKHVNIRTLNVYQGPPPSRSPKAKRTGTKRSLIQEAIRLDVAAPKEAVIEEPFEIAASVRQPDAPKLNVEDLSQVSSQDGAIFRGRQDETVNYRIEVVAGACDVVPPHYVLKLRPHENSRAVFFQVTAHRAGRRSLVVNAYQEDDNLAAATRLQVAIQLPVRSNS